MNCSEFKEQVGAYALGALSADEAASMDAHLAEESTHQGCEQALGRAQRTVAALSSSLDPVSPGEHVWPSIASRLGQSLSGPARKPSRWRQAAPWALVASLGAALFVVNHERADEARRADRANLLLADARSGLAERDRCLKELESMKEGSLLKREAIALLEKPSTKVVPLSPLAGKTYRASAIVNLAERRAIVLASSMPHVAEKDFELWVIRGKEPPAAAGFMHAAGGGIEVGEIDGMLLSGSEPDAFAVSLEPLGGGSTPTDVLMVGALHG